MSERKSCEFDEPIALSGGRKLVSLRDAATYMLALSPKPTAGMASRAEALLLVVEFGGPAMFARIGVMRVLNRHHVQEFDPNRKGYHWVKRKLKRDQ
jgi:hypothetical protein